MFMINTHVFPLYWYLLKYHHQLAARFYNLLMLVFDAIPKVMGTPNSILAAGLILNFTWVQMPDKKNPIKYFVTLCRITFIYIVIT